MYIITIRQERQPARSKIMTKKEIINTLREMGFKANYRNVLISTYEEKGYITVIQNKTEMYIVTKEMLENKTNTEDEHG